jgi:hypothetical protein
MDRQLIQVKRGSRSTYDYVFVWKRKREEDNWESQEGEKCPQVGGIDSVGIVLPNTGIPPHYDDTSMIQR